MNIIEAIHIANAYLLKKTGIVGYPDAVHLVEETGKRSYWSILYYAKLFFQREYAEGSVVDGGEYCLRVDAVTGEVFHVTDT